MKRAKHKRRVDIEELLVRVQHEWWPRKQRPGEGPRYCFGYMLPAGGQRNTPQRQSLAWHLHHLRHAVTEILERSIESRSV